MLLALGLLMPIGAVADEVPILIERVAPQYPRSAARDRVEGYVTLEIEVLADGSTGQLRVLEASPKDVFEGAALAAVANWRFAPSKHASRRGIQTVIFKLGEESEGLSVTTPPEEWPVIKQTPEGIMLVPPDTAPGGETKPKPKP